MNERIKELLFKVVTMGGEDGDLFPSLYTEKQIEEFAELIVRECCEVLEQTEDALDRQKWPTPRGCVEYIKDYFGVE